MAERYTQRQGQYLAFIYSYTRLHKQPPAEADLQAYFGVSASAVHRMVIALEQRGLVQRTPRQACSLQVLLPPERLPDLSGNPPLVPVEEGSFEATYPNIVAWIAQSGWIELGYEPNMDTYARALDEGGMVWSGGRPAETMDEWLAALEAGVGELRDEQGLR